MSRRRKKRFPNGGGASSGGILRGADVEGLATWSLPARCCGLAHSVSEEPVEKEDKSLGSPEWNCSLAEDVQQAPGEDLRARGLQLKIILPAVHLPPTWGGSCGGCHGGPGASYVRVGAAPRVPGL